MVSYQTSLEKLLKLEKFRLINTENIDLENLVDVLEKPIPLVDVVLWLSLRIVLIKMIWYRHGPVSIQISITFLVLAKLN